MARRKYDFDEEDKVKVLLWCARHCCLCGKACGVGIEVAHLDKGSKDIDEAIPLCFDCHAQIGHYDRSHPRGRMFSHRELKARRDQVYEEYTSHLVPRLRYGLSQQGRELPDVGFNIEHLGGPHPAQARITVTLFQGDREHQPSTAGHYDGTYLWNLNPGFGIGGHFKIPLEILEHGKDPLRAKIEATVLDIYKRIHVLLPMGFVIELDRSAEWYLEPCMEEIDEK
jgi:hypothetical protein